MKAVVECSSPKKVQGFGAGSASHSAEMIALLKDGHLDYDRGYRSVAV